MNLTVNKKDYPLCIFINLRQNNKLALGSDNSFHGTNAAINYLEPLLRNIKIGCLLFFKMLKQTPIIYLNIATSK